MFKVLKKNKLLSNIASLGIVQIVNYGFPLITIPIVSRIIGPEKYGVINYAIIFVSYFTMLIAYGFDITATRRLSKDRFNTSLRNQIFSEVFSSQLFLTIISLLIFIPCLFYLDPLNKNKNVAIFTFLLCFGTLFTQNWLFQAMQDLSKIAILNFIGKIIGTASVLILVRKPSDFYWQSFAVGFSSFAVAIISFIWSIKKYQLKISFVPIRTILQLLNKEKAVFFSMVMVSLYTYTNTMMLGIFKPVNEVGYYSAAQKLMEVATTVINLPLAQAFFPYIGEAFGQSKEKGIAILQKTSSLIIVFILSVVIVLFIATPLIIHIFYGRKFDPTITVFRIICFIPLVVGISNILGVQTMLHLKMDKAYFLISLGGGILGLGLNFIMINKWGYIGAGLNYLVIECYITISMFLYLKYHKIQPIKLASFKPRNLVSDLKWFISKK